MATNASQGFTKVFSAVLSEPEASLRSIIFASRKGLATAEKIDDAFPQQVAKVTLHLDAIAPGDFVVRSVIAGARRKIEILATDEQGLGLNRLLSMLPEAGQKLDGQALIEFAPGTHAVELLEAVVVATFKGK
jgi:hypothetical protein